SAAGGADAKASYITEAFDVAGEADLHAASVEATGGAVRVTYTVSGGPVGQFFIGFFRSADATFGGAPTAPLLGHVLINDPADLATGVHVKTYAIGGEVALPGAGQPEVDGDYSILGVLDDLDDVAEADADPFDEDNTRALTGSYRMDTGVVS